ncbi:MAG: O-methyltransferase [Chthoniobacteraceae bacterium]
MNDEIWSKADRWLAATLIPKDDALDQCVAANAGGGLPAIDVSPLQGKLLNLLARMRGARSVLEIGTLGGYSTIWLARALPADGRLVTLELSPAHARVARANISRAGLADKVELIEGPATESLARLHAEGRGPFDLIFIDADKPGYPAYLEWSLKLSAPGTIIIGDNVVRHGQVADEPGSGDENVRAVRAFIEAIAANPRLDATVIQTVGAKGYDGFLIARVVS